LQVDAEAMLMSAVEVMHKHAYLAIPPGHNRSRLQISNGRRLEAGTGQDMSVMIVSVRLQRPDTKKPPGLRKLCHG
jgi:hypothetical protein